MSITLHQILGSLLAVLAFAPATVCSGFSAAWLANLHAFRKRTFVEQIFWSIPLSFAISTIASILIGKFLSLDAVAAFFALCALLCVGILLAARARRKRSGELWALGSQPLGVKALFFAVLWMLFVVFSLCDFEANHRLFLNVALLDQSYRVSWIEAVLRTGVPPANPEFFYGHPAGMRNYYFWYVLCAGVAKPAHLPARAVFTASCVWAGFGLAAIIGLFLKHVLIAGDRLRAQFLMAIGLLVVTGLDVIVVVWNFVALHIQPPADLEAWSKDGIPSWLHTLFWAPHHATSMVCCLFALLLAWMARKQDTRTIAISVALIAVSLASAFGLSIYVTVAFFLVTILWAIWMLALERAFQPVLSLFLGGIGALVLLFPYLQELTHSSGTKDGGSLFSCAVRQMIPPDGLLKSHLFAPFAVSHPLAALNAAKLILLFPGYALEFGFYAVVFLVYLVPAWRGRVRLSAAQRCLVVIGMAALPFMSFMRSGVLLTNDFAWRSALFLQFPALLLASEVITSWKMADQNSARPSASEGLPRLTPRWLRAVASFALIFGVFSTICQALMFRFLLPLGDIHVDAGARSMSQRAYSAAVGYAALDKAIPRNAVVQFNPENQDSDRLAMIVTTINVNHQTAIASDKGGCGSEMGGDPAGCPVLAHLIDPLFHGSSAEQARQACRQAGIQYLVADTSDAAWKDPRGWVWTLKPVVADPDFRAVECAP